MFKVYPGGVRFHCIFHKHCFWASLVIEITFKSKRAIRAQTLYSKVHVHGRVVIEHAPQ